MKIIYTIIGLALLVGLGLAAAYFGKGLTFGRNAQLSSGEYQVPVGYKTYTNADYGFAFDYLAGDQLEVWQETGDESDGSIWGARIAPAGSGSWSPLGFGETVDWLTREVKITVYETKEDWERARQQQMEFQTGLNGLRGRAKTVVINGIKWQVFYLINEESGQAIDAWAGVLKSGYGILVESEADWGDDQSVPQETLRSVRNL